MKVDKCDICKKKTITVKLAFGPRACWPCIGKGVKRAEKKKADKKAAREKKK